MVGGYGVLVLVAGAVLLLVAVWFAYRPPK
jgi:hypothetical protein